MLLLRCRFCRAFFVLHLPLRRLDFVPSLVDQPSYIRIIPASPTGAPNNHLNGKWLMAATEEFMGDCEHVVVPAIACSVGVFAEQSEHVLICEAARLLGISPVAARSRLHRARRRLRLVLEGQRTGFTARETLEPREEE